MEEDISNAMEQLLDLTISLQTRINQAYSDLCDYTLSQCVISLMKVNVSLDDFISLVSDLELSELSELSEDDARLCTQIITDTASTLKAASEEIQQLVDDLAKSAISSK
ncbi:TPA: transporter [Escherichia coli]|nr:transporter [Escherichia coli]EGM9639822.1 transporter [Escherichia coli]HAL3733544.1 transporter [Escherichia coli]